jgi:hypothetical protein
MSDPARIFGPITSDDFERRWNETWGQPSLDRVLALERALGVDYKTVLYHLGKIHPNHGRHYFARFHIDHRRRFGVAPQPTQ